MLKERVAIITGGTKGIGKAIADKLSSLRIKVVICARKKENTRHYFIKCDVSKIEEVKNLVNETIRKFGRIDILVNNAGIFPSNLLKDMTEEQWNNVISVNLNGVFNCTRLIIPYMIKAKYGKIINIASIAGTCLGFQGLTHYCTTKAGLSGFTKSAALELAEYKINVNAVAPGLISTPGVDNFMSKREQLEFSKIVPLKRNGKPEDIAELTAFLASDSSSYITGQTITVDGGYTIQ
ncbi:SDR family oxidoreductase [Candidatus Woesearchaeota archaeon]|nr:SDR family oxidoreductase [Candidatus Woesearchaeota archaeon]